MERYASVYITWKIEIISIGFPHFKTEFDFEMFIANIHVF